MRKPVFGISDQVQHKLGCTKEVEQLYHLCSKNKGADQRPSPVNGQLICAFVLAYAKSIVSLEAAHFG